MSTLELDLGVTKDGVVVVSHDRALGKDLVRGPDGQWLAKPGPALSTLTHAELQKYDVGRIRPGTAYALQFKDQTGADGVRMPALHEVYALARRAGNEVVRFNVETKIDPRHPGETLPPEAFAAAVVRAVNAAGAASRTSIQSFDWRTLRHVQKLAPEIETVYLTAQEGGYQLQPGQPGASPWLAGLDIDEHGGSVPRLVVAAGGRVWSPRYRDLTPESLAEAHRLGLRVIPWTVNDPAEMTSMLALGVNGLITDRPDLLRRVMQDKGLPLPAPTPVEAR